MGAHFLLNIYSRVFLLQWLDAYQDKIWATALDGHNPSDLYQLDLNAPCAWVFGQLSTMLKVGLSFENAMEDMSKYGQGPLYDEVKRTIIEIRMGRNFDDAWIAMSKRLKSRDLERIFLIILDGRKSGSSMANVINNVSDDLRDLLALKRERKATVMMSIMFLFISAVIATPFALAMVSIYSGFMQNFGESSQLILVTPIVGQIYLIIHSILVNFIIN